MNRRTLTAALPASNLSQEAINFVRGEACPTAGCPPVDPSSKADSPGIEITPGPKLQVQEQTTLPAEPNLVSLTVRVPRSVPPSLLLAAVDRKLKRLRPWTQQEIVAQLLTAWLKQNGYLS